MVKNKMNGEERRNKIIDYIEHSPVPVSGTALANHFSVSRQAVVQDIALQEMISFQQTADMLSLQSQRFLLAHLKFHTAMTRLLMSFL